ncbi:DUF805 domain-containing protein [Modestobacter sp. SYSU DS0511]
MNIAQWYVSRGRIPRRTFWLHYFLPITAASLVLQLVVMTTVGSTAPPVDDGGGIPGIFWVFLVFWLAALPPSISSQATRLHDRGHSAWWLLFLLLPVVGPIVLLVQMCLPGEERTNDYGPPPAGERVPEPGYPQSYR